MVREVVIQIANAENNVTHLAELKELLRNYMIWHQRVRHSTSTLELYEKHIENYTKNWKRHGTRLVEFVRYANRRCLLNILIEG